MFEAVADEVFTRYARNWKPGTLKVNWNYYRNHILPHFKGRLIAGIDSRDVRQWFASLHAKPAAADRSAPILSVIMRQAEIYGYRPEGSNPCKGIKRYRREGRERFLSAAENYHHVIHSLRTKPQALAGLRYRDQLFPRTAYRRCWDALSAALDQRSACTIMVGLLWLAHDRACEAELAQQLDELLAADRLPDLKLLEQRFVAHLNDVPVVTVDIPGADSYDALFAARELAA